MKLPILSLVTIEGGTGYMCALPGTSIVAIAGKQRGVSTWIVHLVDSDSLLLLSSATLHSSSSGSSALYIVALKAQAVNDCTVHVAAALAFSDGKVGCFTASLSLSGMSLSANASGSTSVAFKLGNSVVETALMSDVGSTLLLEDDGSVRVKRVTCNSLMTAALLEGNVLLAWRAT